VVTKDIKGRFQKLKEDIAENKLEDAGLRWYTEKRVKHIGRLLVDLNKLKDLGFDSVEALHLQIILLELLLSYHVENFPSHLKRHLDTLVEKAGKRYEVPGTSDELNGHIDKVLIELDRWTSEDDKERGFEILKKYEFRFGELPEATHFLTNPQI